jgi:hypothetical protein
MGIRRRVFPCFEVGIDSQEAVFIKFGERVHRKIPKKCVVRGNLAYVKKGMKMEATALLDTGCDHSILNPHTLRRLEDELDISIPVFGSVLHEGEPKPVISEVCYLIPDFFVHYDEWGFILEEHWKEEGIDLMLGSDFFRKVLACFNGPGNTVTLEVDDSFAGC